VRLIRSDSNFQVFRPLSVHGWTLIFLDVLRLCPRGQIEPFSATLVQDGFAECDRPGKDPLEYFAMAGN